MDLNFLTRRFLGEAVSSGGKPSLFGYLQSLEETIRTFRPSTLREKRLLEIGLSHLREMAKGIKRLIEEKTALEEQMTVLTEERDKLKKKHILLKLKLKKKYNDTDE
jgi:hypothetical protein